MGLAAFQEFIQKTKNKIWQADTASDKEGYAVPPAYTTLELGKIYKASVLGTAHPENACSCVIEENNPVRLDNCIFTAGVFSSMFGFKTNFTPARGTSVLLLFTGGQFNYIIGCTGHFLDFPTGLGRSQALFDKSDKNPIKPWDEMDSVAMYRKGPQASSDAEAKQGILSGERNWDQTDGELEITNLLGVGANFLQHLAQLKAGDLAVVETSVVDDMVRIISGNFKHHSAFGDYKIYNDGGRLNVKWEGTNADWEAWGKDEHNAVKVEEGSDNEFVDPGVSKLLEQDSKWRFSQFVGFLGDFVTTFITDPIVWQEGANYIQQERSGKSKLHLNDDGTILVSSINEITLEKLPRLSVPLQQKPEYHKDGNKPADEFLSNTDPLKNWSFQASGGEENVHYVIYQIREYCKWLTNTKANQQFIRQDKDWKVPSEAEVPEPDYIGQEDKEKKTANSGINTPDKIKETYATIKIAKDGSILLLDSYENTVTMSKTGLTLASHNNVHIEAPGSINMTAGRDINLLAKKSVDVSAVKGGVSVRGESFIQNYSRGGILFESESYDSDEIFSTVDKPEVEQDDKDRIKGIVLKTTGSHIRVESGRDLGLKSVVNQFQVANGTIGVESGRYQVNSTLEVYPKSVSATGKSQNSSMYGAAGGGGSTDGMGYVRVDGMFVGEKVLTNFLLQYAEDMRPQLCDENGFPGGGPFCHPFHVLTTDEEEFDTTIEKTDAAKYKAHSTAAKFMYRKEEEYGTDSKEGKPYQSITQQALMTSLFNDELVTEEYEAWSVVQESKLPGRRKPWPARDTYMKFQTSQRIYTPDSRDPKSVQNKAAALTGDSYQMKTIE